VHGWSSGKLWRSEPERLIAPLLGVILAGMLDAWKRFHGSPLARAAGNDFFLKRRSK
jgi:hypothetical protein